MRPRYDIRVMFSTFLQWSEDRSNGWSVDAGLRRSMEKVLQAPSESHNSDNFWALYWHECWQAESHSLAEAHLSAYLQESGYWAAQKMSRSFVSQQYQLFDCFQIALLSVGKVLKGFNPTLGTRLKDYASVSFRSMIRDTLRQRWETDLCSHWALLRKLSQKRFVESLENAGLTPEEIARYQLAWACFKDLYAPRQEKGMRQLPAPTAETWGAIARSYNTERNQLTPPGSQCSPETIEKWLRNSAKAVRTYLYPKVESLNVPKQGEGFGEVLDDLPDTANESLLSDAIAQEERQKRENQQGQLNAALAKALAQLAPYLQEMLKLYYGGGMTQQEIARQLEMKQYTISRRLTKTRESLLKALAQWSQETLKVSLDSEISPHMSVVLEEWLQGYYMKSG